MYGMINQAVEQLVRKVAGEAGWHAVRERAGLPDTPFTTMAKYPDDVTYRLVEASSAVLEIPPSDVLVAFGEEWVQFTLQQGYGALFLMSGSNLPEFLENLGRLHTHVAAGFPGLHPPVFWSTDPTNSSIRVHYKSNRIGLAPMCVGLLRGLGKFFATEVRVTHDKRSADGADHDEFLVEYQLEVEYLHER